MLVVSVKLGGRLRIIITSLFCVLSISFMRLWRIFSQVQFWIWILLITLLYNHINLSNLDNYVLFNSCVKLIYSHKAKMHSLEMTFTHKLCTHFL